MKVVKKLSKEQKSLLIAMLLGDGTICNNNVYKLSHAKEQYEYLSWKVKLLKSANIQTSDIKEYTSKCGYNAGKNVLYTQLRIIPTIKALRRCVYKPKKTLTRRLLNWLDARGIAIWYMDDGHLNVNTSKQRSNIQHTVHLTTCVDFNTATIIQTYFQEVWNIKFRVWEERKNLFSLATCGELETIKFLNIVKPFVEQVPSFLYKIRKDFTKEEFLQRQKEGLKCETLV